MFTLVRVVLHVKVLRGSHLAGKSKQISVTLNFLFRSSLGQI